MHLFTGFMQTLTNWLYLHPHLALLITFLVSFSESLAIVGSIVPGSITMTAVGVLAGSGIMRIDLTLLAATLGAVAGDSASYILGFACKDRLQEWWPFCRYPNLLENGKLYFEKHGKKSVLIGRFFGPLRSMTPLIAGMMGMNQWHFLIANILSAIGWATLYVMPGVLIGAASHELSPEDATKLFVVLILILLGIWLVSLGFIKLMLRINVWLAKHLHLAWSKLKHKTAYIWLFRLLTPRHEKNHYPTVMLPIFCGISFISLIVMLLLAHTSIGSSLNQSVYLFLQNMRTTYFDKLFIILSFVINSLSLAGIALGCMAYALYFRDKRIFTYWLSLTLLSTLSAIFLNELALPLPKALTHANLFLQYSTIKLCTATALLSFLIFYVYQRKPTHLTKIIQFSISILLFLTGFSYLYLGDNWLTNVLSAIFLGLTLSLCHWIFYRKVFHKQKNKPLLILIVFTLLTFSILLLCIFKLDTTLKSYKPQITQYVIDDTDWRTQSKPLLPIYRTNRIGKAIGYFNVQYHGSLDTLKQALLAHGWKVVSDSLLNHLILRAQIQGNKQQLPFMTEKHLNQKPIMTMVYRPGTQSSAIFLRLWVSNYSLPQSPEHILLGSLTSSNSQSIENDQKLFLLLKKSLPSCQTDILEFTDSSRQLSHRTTPYSVLLIDENQHAKND